MKYNIYGEVLTPEEVLLILKDAEAVKNKPYKIRHKIGKKTKKIKIQKDFVKIGRKKKEIAYLTNEENDKNAITVDDSYIYDLTADQ